MTSNHHAPYDLGYTRATMDGTTRSEPAKASGSLKAVPSSDCRLQPAYTKPESLVMAHQLRRREYVPGSCTHRPSHHGSRSHPKYLKPTARRQGPKVRLVTGMKS